MLSKPGEGLLVNEVTRAQPASRANSRGLSARLLAFAGKNKTYKKIGKRFKASSLLLGRRQGLSAVNILTFVQHLKGITCPLAGQLIYSSLKMHIQKLKLPLMMQGKI